MVHQRIIGTGLGLVVALLCMLGCGGVGSGPTAPVIGTVTYHGRPVENAQVVFMPETGRPAFGVTDASGRFTLSTFRSGDGAAPGSQMVAISAADVGPGPPRDEQADDGDDADDTEDMESRRSPARYATPQTSGLTANVEMGKTNEFTFDMVE